MWNHLQNNLVFTSLCLSCFILTGCAYIGPPQANVRNEKLLLLIKNNSIDGWKDCSLTLNPDAPIHKQYTGKLDTVGGEDTVPVLITQFKNKEGKRFIPFVNDVDALKIQCNQPILPTTVSLTQDDAGE